MTGNKNICITLGVGIEEYIVQKSNQVVPYLPAPLTAVSGESHEHPLWFLSDPQAPSTPWSGTTQRIAEPKALSCGTMADLVKTARYKEIGRECMTRNKATSRWAASSLLCCISMDRFYIPNCQRSEKNVKENQELTFSLQKIPSFLSLYRHSLQWGHARGTTGPIVHRSSDIRLSSIPPVC